jgi:polar amino acid transport system substrate-binding protein
MNRVAHRARVLVAAVAATLAAAGLAACTGGADDGLVLPAASSSTPPATSAAPTSPSASTAPCSRQQRLASYAPSAAVTGYTAKIKQRGYLVAGISADTLLFGSRNPVDGTIEGFDIDVLKQVSQALFGNPDKIRFVVITAGQRLASVQGDVDAGRSADGSAPPVDIVARTMSITCDRWKSVAFSAEYFTAGQSVLVPKGQRAEIGALDGKKVCAPAGTSSLEKLKEYPKVVPVTVARHTECLALFQEGSVDAITGDNTVLAGFAAQDPYAEVGTARFSEENYGLAIGPKNVDFVRFVNSVLDRMRADGTWTNLYNRWLLAPLDVKAPAPPAPVYER